MAEIPTLSDYMREYYKNPTYTTLSDDLKTFFDSAKSSIPLTLVGAPQPDPSANYKPGAPQPEPS
jgi:hypothetical protein